MKKLLLILLLSVGLINAQDQTYIDNLLALDSIQSVKVSNEIASLSTTKWEVLQVAGNAKILKVKYVDSSLDKSFVEKLKKGKALAEPGQTFTVLFSKSADIYKLQSFGGKYEDIFPYWQRYFVLNANKDSLPNDYDQQELKYKGHLYKFTHVDGSNWVLKNIY